MNLEQVEALAKLMRQARPLRHFPEDPEPDIQVRLEVAHGYDNGNTYEATLWSVISLDRFTEPFYIRDDGTVYVYDMDADTTHRVERVAWRAADKYRYRLKTERAEEALTT